MKIFLPKERPLIMGIVNATPDSFFDGGRCEDPEVAVAHALRLASEGADILDVGGESTRPGASPVALQEELRRVIPVVEGIRKGSSLPISIDTTKAEVARLALGAGAEMINDISAGSLDPGMLGLAAERGVPICLMHMQGEPRTMQVAPHYGDLIGEIRAFLAEATSRALRAGVGKDRIILDPGIGFGKRPEDNVEILRRLPELFEPGAQVLVGPSRKSFIGKLLGHQPHERLEATLAALALAIEGGARILRVHDVGAVRRFCDAYLAFRAPPGSDGLLD